ncbi:MAG: adenylate/guanylate cyclase domain-containing protein [Solirubrobacterales bacterium]|nr:adenylate/guanylate cyclase domain-containing protein [Solirubrobacterales bacterium]
MLRGPLHWAYRRFGPAYPRLAVLGVLSLSFFVVAGGVWLLDLCVDLDGGEFWRIFLVTMAMSVVEAVTAFLVLSKLLRPADPWLQGERAPEDAVAAWRAVAGMPQDFLTFGRFVPVVFNVLPVALFITWELDEGLFPALPIVIAGVAVVLLYGVFVRFFGLEMIGRPVLEEVSCELPDGAELGSATVPLVLPSATVQIFTFLSAPFASPEDSGLDQLGLGVVVTIAVSFTLSLELSGLLLRSIVEPIHDLQQGTRRVAEGDLSVRVPVLGTDETGKLAGSFNQMVAGLAERERLREAFGAFVDPHLAERVLVEGTVLEGEEVEVTVLFLDIREFTAFAERSTAREVVERLNEFYEIVVPVLAAHGGHANKFIGDGLLGVFGAPDRLPGHADCALEAALEIVRCVRERYGDELRIGIGVNSGPVVAGTIGGGGRLEFTVIGDAVNTAARVEELTRDTGDDVLVTAATCGLLERAHGGFVDRGETVLKGKTERVRLHAPVRAAAPTAPTPRALRAVRR